MKTKFLSFAAISLAMALSFVSCQEKGPEGDDPGKTDTVVADVYFSVQNGDYCYYVGKDSEVKAELLVIRENSSIADDYEIKVLSSDNGVEIPSVVSFKEGESQTSITVSGPANGNTGESYSFEIMFTGDNVNPSANSTLGTTRCEGTFYFYEELTSAACFLPWGSTGNIWNYMGDMKQIIWRLDNYNYIFKNFLGSKYDLKVIVDPATNYIKNIIYGYDLYADIDEEGGTTYSFYNGELEEFTETEGWEEFAPKGDRRVITGLTLYLDPASAYSCYVPGSSTSTEWFYFAVPSVYMASEEDDFDVSLTNWQYLCFFLYSDDKLATCDFVGFPELDVIEYPEPVYSEEEKDGKIPFQFYIENEDVYFDTQYATKTDKGYVFEDFMMSECTLTLIPNGTTFSIEVTDAEGTVLSNGISDGYRYLGMEYIFPWASNDYWCIYSLYMYNDSAYTIWSEADKYACFYASYNIYNGDEETYMGSTAGYLYIYW